MAVESKVRLAVAPIVEKTNGKNQKSFEPRSIRADGGIVYITGKVDGMIVQIKARLSAMGGFAVETLRPYCVKVGDGLVNIKAKLGTSIVYIRIKASAAVHSVEARTLAAYTKVYTGAVRGIESAVAASVRTYGHARARATNIVEPSMVRVKDGALYLQARVGESVMVVRTRIGGACGQVKASALVSYASARKGVEDFLSPVTSKAAAIFEPVAIKIKGGVMYVKGRVGGSIVVLKTKAFAISHTAAGALEPYFIRVRHGVMYITGRIGEVIVRIEAKISEAQGAAKSITLGTLSSTLQMAETYCGPLTARAASTRDKAMVKILSIRDAAAARTKVVTDGAKVMAADPKARATAASAAGGAVALGASGGAAGFVGGGTIGAVLGVVPAVFTFGLSIPIGAAIGSGAGLCIGTVAGGTMGLVSGGAAGYGVQTHRTEIAQGMSAALAKASDCKDYVKQKSFISKKNGLPTPSADALPEATAKEVPGSEAP